MGSLKQHTQRDKKKTRFLRDDENDGFYYRRKSIISEVVVMVKLPLFRFHGVFVLFSLVLVSSSAFVAEFEEEEDSKNTFLRRSDGFNDDDENDVAKGRRQSFLGGSSSSSSSKAADVGNRARWLFERSGNVRWSLKNEDDDDDETTKSFSLKDVIYNGFCAELNEDDGIKVDGDVSSFSYIVSREYEPIAFQAVDDYVVALERQ